MIAAFSSAAAASKAPDWNPRDLSAFMAPPRPSAEGWQQLFNMGLASPVDDATPDDVQTATQPGEARIMPSRELDGEQSERTLFQLHGTYILAQLRNGYMVVDQQRAHERVLYERNLKLLENGAGVTQTELFPRHVELNAADLAMVEEVLPDLRKMGFDLELFGGRTVQVNGMPAEAADEDPTRLLENLLEQLKQQKGGLRNERHQVLATGMARSMAIRAGRNLTSTEMSDLIDRLFACEMPYTTSSGKPTLITYGLDELNERFER